MKLILIKRVYDEKSKWNLRQDGIGKENGGGDEEGMGPIPPPFPNGKGAGRVMVVVIFRNKATFVWEGISFSPLGETGEGFSCGKIPIMPVKNIIPGQTVTKEKLQRAKELRRDMTPAEKILWQELRANKLGVHFRRQQVIAGFIVDFYCHKAALVIELDGDVHEEAEQKENDVRRDKALDDLGLRIVRFKNDEVLKNLSTVVGKIKEQLNWKSRGSKSGSFNFA